MAVPEHMDLQPELTWDLRPLLVDFLIEIHAHFLLQPETLYLAMNMMDRYLSKRVVYKKHYQLVGMTSLWISSKYEDSKERLPSVNQLCKLCSNTYDEAAFITMERHILKTLDYGLGHPTAEAFLKKDLEVSGQDDLRLRHVAQFLMELTMFTRCFLSFGSSTIAASALFLARSICGHPLVVSFCFTGCLPPYPCKEKGGSFLSFQLKGPCILIIPIAFFCSFSCRSPKIQTHLIASGIWTTV